MNEPFDPPNPLCNKFPFAGDAELLGRSLTRIKIHLLLWLLDVHFFIFQTRTRLSELPKDYFNLTMSYRSDSDIPFKYFTMNKRDKAVPIPSLDCILKTFPKPKLVAWFVSHCETNSKRELYVNELQKYIGVDIYGKCGTLKCGSKRGREEKCYRMLQKKYHFYLSFENALCR